MNLSIKGGYPKFMVKFGMWTCIYFQMITMKEFAKIDAYLINYPLDFHQGMRGND